MRGDVESKKYFPGQCLEVAAKAENLEAVRLFMPHVGEYTILDVLKKSFAAGHQGVVDVCVNHLRVEGAC